MPKIIERAASVSVPAIYTDVEKTRKEYKNTNEVFRGNFFRPPQILSNSERICIINWFKYSLVMQCANYNCGLGVLQRAKFGRWLKTRREHARRRNPHVNECCF